MDVQSYQMAYLGCLAYATTATRPDLAAAVGILSKYMSRPGKDHWQGVKRVLCYIKGTLNYGLTFTANGSDPSLYSLYGSDLNLYGLYGSDPSLYGLYGSDPSLYGLYGSDPSLYGLYGSDPSLYGSELSLYGSDPSLHGLYGSDPSLYGYSVADWGGDVKTRCLTSEYVFLIHNNTISWCSKRQTSVSRSTTRAG